MAFLFARNRSKVDPVKATKELLPRMWDTPPNPKVEEELAKYLAQMKLILQGTQETDSSPELVAQLVTSIVQEDILSHLARSIRLLPFESRKDTQTIFSYLLRYRIPGQAESSPPVVEYIIHERPEIVRQLCLGYEHRESAMPCGIILREALKYEDIALILLYDQSVNDTDPFNVGDIDETLEQDGTGIFWNFFGWIDKGAFEVSTDAFNTFKDILTKNRSVVAYYLGVNFDLFFSRFNRILVGSSSYVTKRQSIKLLGELLLDRTNYSVMTAYVGSGDFLKLCMTVLKDDRKMVQYEAFHVFKVFVANPNKSVAVQKILINNRDRLLKFLPVFLEDRTDDEQFTDEKSFLIRQIETLPPQPVSPPAMDQLSA